MILYRKAQDGESVQLDSTNTDTIQAVDLEKYLKVREYTLDTIPDINSEFKLNIDQFKVKQDSTKIKKYGDGGQATSVDNPFTNVYHAPGEIFDPLVEGLPETVTSKDMILSIMGEYGGSYEDYVDLMDGVSVHESKELVDRQYSYYNPKKKQVLDSGKDGVGRGLFQFETGKNEGGIVAVRRAYNYLTEKGIEVPEWIMKAREQDSFDATTVSADNQKVLFWAFHRMGPSELKNYVDGKLTIDKFWGKWHQTSEDKEKEKLLIKDIENAKKVDWKKFKLK